MGTTDKFDSHLRSHDSHMTMMGSHAEVSPVPSNVAKHSLSVIIQLRIFAHAAKLT